MDATVTKIILTKQPVSFEKGPMGWVATGWEKGLPVARKPITEAYLADILSRYPDYRAS